MRTKFSGFLTLLLAFVVQLSFAQQKTISGTITDNTGMPLPGVNIVVKGTNTGTQSDFDGNYSIDANVGQTLVFSYVGFETTERAVTASTSSVSIEMTEGAMLDEVVVTAYGRTRTRNELTGSVVTVGTEDIQKTPFVSVEQALQGKVSGLTVNTTSGVPGATQQIRIRGIQSVLAGNEPLYVIDGVPVTQGNASGSTSVTAFNLFALIGSDNIESISVLKDAISTAPYGASGSNGVILVTTKKGKSGDARFSLAASTGVINNAREGFVPLSGQQKWELVQSGLWNNFGTNGYGGTGAITENSESAIYEYIENNLSNSAGYKALIQWTNDGRPNYDWADAVRNEDALMQNVDFSVSQGSDKYNLYASLGYNFTEATVIGSNFERVNGSIKFSSQLTDKFRLSTNATIANARQNAALENAGYYSNPNLSKFFLNPWINPYDANGKPNIDPELFVGLTSLHNTLHTAKESFRRNDVTRALQSTSINYTINDNLSFESLFSIDYSLAYYKEYRSPIHGDGEAIGGYIYESSVRSFDYTSQNQLNYKFNLGEKHNFHATLLSEFSRYNTHQLAADGSQLINEYMQNLSAATSEEGNLAYSGFSDRTSLRYVGMLSYNYDQKYVVEGSVSYQGDSRFIKENRYDWFYSVGGAWNIHKENFMSDVSFMNELRLKGGYGITGNSAIGRNLYQSLASVGGYNGEGAMVISRYGSNVKWETGLKQDLALEFSLWDRRIKGNVSYYSNETIDLILNAPLGQSAQYIPGAAIQNIGNMTNKGFEIDLGVDIISTDDFNWNIGGNFSTNKNMITKTHPDSEIIGNTRVVQEGHMLHEWYLVEWAGVNPDNGDPQYWTNTPILDENGEQTGVERELTNDPSTATQVYMGTNYLPKYSGSISTRFDYKGFFTEATLYGAGGHQVYDSWAVRFTQSSDLGRFVADNTTSEVYHGAWREPGDIATHPRIGIANQYVDRPNSRFLYDGDFLRLRDLAIGYTLNQDFVKQIGFEGISFALRGTNLFTWTKDKRLKADPEVRVGDGPGDALAGNINLTTPPIKSIVFQINLNF